MSNYGVTKYGFRKKRLDEIIQEIETNIATNLGVPINTAPDSAFSQITKPFSDKLAELWDVAEDEYYSKYPSSAEGVSLDNAISLSGVTRKKTTKTKLYITCVGVDGTIIPSGAKVRRTQGKIEYFSAINSGKISMDSARGVGIKVSSLTDNTDYFITLDGKVYSYRTGAGATQADVLNGFKASITSLDWLISIENDILVIDRADKSGSHIISISGNLIADHVKTNILFFADEYGPINPPVGTVNEIVTPEDGWTGCSNDLSAVIGQNTESDTEARLNYAARVPARSKANVDAIKAAILQYVSGVSECYVFENASHLPDSEGRPPHSFEVVVEGGEDIEIAEQIFITKTGGAPLVGTTEVALVDSSGTSHTMRFNRSQKVNAWVKVTASPKPNKELPDDAVGKIVAAIVEEGNSYVMGADIPVQAVFGSIYTSVTDLGVLIVKMAISENAPLEADYKIDILDLTAKQKAVFSPDRIEVTII